MIAKPLIILDARVEERSLRYYKRKLTKMAPLWYLVEKQGVGLGTGSKNDQKCATFVQCVTKDQQLPLVAKAKYFSIQIDGSTDSTNVEGEVFLILILILMMERSMFTSNFLQLDGHYAPIHDTMIQLRDLRW